MYEHKVFSGYRDTIKKVHPLKCVIDIYILYIQSNKLD